MFEQISIESNRGPYTVHFQTESHYIPRLSSELFYIIDSNVAKLYQIEFQELLRKGRYLLIEACEPNKSLDQFPSYIEKMVEKGIKRSDVLVAVGGGIIQDITCFLSSTLMRGLQWEFVPTTLLSQCDSCIGSKSSINSGHIKNILGTFNPPRTIHIYPNFLNTLQNDDMRSGIGEMIKVHIIAGLSRFREIAAEYDNLLTSQKTLLQFVRESLLIKKSVIEIDEFDLNIRNVMNYGHSFGHALESASDYAIPHGIAVTIGMDIANWVARDKGRISSSVFEEFHQILFKNFDGYQNTPLDMQTFFDALGKDKKRTSSSSLNAIIPNNQAIPEKFNLSIDMEFKKCVTDYMKSFCFDQRKTRGSINDEESESTASLL